MCAPSGRSSALCAARRARDVVALRQALLAVVIRRPTTQLAEFGEHDVQPAAGGLVVGRLVEQVGDRPELLLGQREHRAATGHVVHRAQLGDHGGEPVNQRG